MGEVLEPAAVGLSPLAKKLSDGLNSAKPLDQVLSELSARLKNRLSTISPSSQPGIEGNRCPTELEPRSKPVMNG